MMNIKRVSLLLSVLLLLALSLACSLVTGEPSISEEPNFEATVEAAVSATQNSSADPAGEELPDEDPPADEPPEVFDPPLEDEPPDGDVFSFQGVSFIVPPAWEAIVQAEVVAEEPFVDDMPPFAVYPEHIAFHFAPEDHFETMISPTIAVYRVDDIQQMFVGTNMSTAVNETMSTLQGSIASGLAAANIPVFPFIGAAELFRDKAEVLAFQNGSGVRALAQYGQAYWFIHNGGVSYYYQGLTEDGQFYVTVRLPVRVTFLIDGYEPSMNANPSAIQIQEYDMAVWEETEAAITAYNDEVYNRFQSMQPDELFPSLASIDALVASLRVEEN
jgi:hypothetical protein